MDLHSLRGGLNNTDPPSALDADAATEAVNVEWLLSTLGEKRKGTTAVNIAGSALETAGLDAVTFLFRHLPTSDEADAELWALGVDLSGTSNALARKTNAWATVTPDDGIDTEGRRAFEVAAQTLHGKLFVAYKSDEDFLHVWDGTLLRRVGLPAPSAAPTVTDTGSGSYATTRYFRVRFTEQVSGSTVRRSEPSAVQTFSPSGSGSGASIARPTLPDEGETHWEVEASLNNADWYRIATVAVGTASYTDSTAAATGYWVATDDSEYPDTQLVLHTNLTRSTAEGVRKGWTTFTGRSANALCSCLFSENIDDDSDRGLTLKPFIGLAEWTVNGSPVRDFIQRCGTGSTDAFTEGDTSAECVYRAVRVPGRGGNSIGRPPLDR